MLKIATGHTQIPSTGWSDKILVTCKKTSYRVDDTRDHYGGSPHSMRSVAGANIPLGPCSYNSTFATVNNVPICGFDEGLF